MPERRSPPPDSGGALQHCLEHRDSQRTKDTLVTTAAVVVFWPAAFFVGGDKQTAAELAQMKGQMIAIEQASTVKKCGIQFQGKPEGSYDTCGGMGPLWLAPTFPARAPGPISK
jgi:hypothetical protein